MCLDHSTCDCGAVIPFTAKKCPHGHLERRFTTTGGCLACMSIHQKKVDKKLREKRALEIISKSVENVGEKEEIQVDDNIYNEEI